MGGYTTNQGGATQIDREYRRAVAMTDAATLAAPLDAVSTRVRIANSESGEFPFHASTADEADSGDNSKYCFWIRVGDERMKVVEADPQAGELTVVRGFESAAAAHEAGAMVFVPVYVGNRNDLNNPRHSNSWPGGPDYLRYALDPANSDTQRYKADLIAELMKTGYDGAWLDTFQVGTYNLCDPLGNRVAYYWDFRANQRYDLERMTAAIQDMLRGIRQLVKQSVGREPYLAANSVSGSYDRGGKNLMSDASRPNLLDGYCFEDSYLRPILGRREPGARGRLNASFDVVPEARWLKNLTNQRDCARDGLTAYCMIGPAGYVAAYINDSLPNYDRLIRFSWCSFLLAVTKEKNIQFGLPLMIERQGKGVGFKPLPAICRAPIGEPLDDRDIEALRSEGLQTLIRPFSNGLVLARPGGEGAEERVEIEPGYIDWETGQPVRELTIAPGDAALLLRAE
ncbi:MAG: hypothetical protein BWZ10_02253 [candidate division BRC1 bacterium ADurb.BinA364]|nr:MAG: hypothetical protein BWZ10_02253 [candidate division BRC1 bacterium ADurb.BinA364]